MFVRPCAAVADHMMALALNNKRLHFENRWAEQSFIEWYNRYSGLRLDSMYCCDPELLRKTHNRTAGGADPLLLHFAFNKPFEITPADHRWEWMCYRPQLVGSLPSLRVDVFQTLELTCPKLSDCPLRRACMIAAQPLIKDRV